jgi:PAS domain S-box-containing protein
MSSADQMDSSGTPAKWLRTWPRQYGFAVAAVILAGLARYALRGVFGPYNPFILFYFPILAVAVLAGVKAGLFATVLSAAIADYFFIHPLHSFTVADPREGIRLALFIAVGVGISWLGHGTYAGEQARNLDERSRSEAMLHESEDRYRDLVEHSEDLLCIHDLEGRLVSVNSAPARILGYSVEELLKIPMRELIIPEGRQLFEEYLERLRTTGAPEKGLLCVTTRRGEVRTWEYSNSLRTDVGGDAGCTRHGARRYRAQAG